MSSDIARGIIEKLKAENEQLKKQLKDKQAYRIEISYEPKRHTKNRRRA